MMKLFAHPFSSYCQKAQIALYENATPFEYRFLEDPGAMDELAALWPLKKFPLVVDGDHIGDGGDRHHRASRRASSRSGAADPG
jgi:glutathione S-transferase